MSEKELPKTYARESSGLVREWSQTTAAIFNFLVIGMLTTAMPFLLIVAPTFLSGANIPLAYLIAAILITPFLLTYSMLISSIPRSGGDYVFMSRILHPSIGFAIVTGSATVYFCCWMAWNGWLLATLGVSTPALIIGRALSSASLLSLASWAATTEGIFSLTLFSIFFPALLISFGMKIYARIQWILFIGLVLSSFTILGILVTTSPASFQSAFNNFFAQDLGNNAYQSIIQTAKSAGYSLSTFNIGHTIVLMGAVLSGHLLWAWFSTPMAGEIKGASQFKQTAASMILPMLCSAAAMTAIIVAYYNTLTPEFLGSISFLFYNGDPAVANLPFEPYYITLPQIMVAGSSVIIAIIAFGYICQLVYFNATNILIPVKYLFAQAFDGILPRKVAYIQSKYHTPLVAIVIMIIGGTLWTAISWVQPTLWDYVTAVIVANTLQFAIGCIAGVLFPYRMKETFEASPIAKYKIGGIPAITITGLLSLIGLGYGLYVYLTFEPLGVAASGAAAYGTIAGIFIACFIVYYIAKAYWGTKKVDLGITFKEIPPE